jgi:hypothetical protein
MRRTRCRPTRSRARWHSSAGPSRPSPHLALAIAEREPDSLGIKIDSAFRSLHGNARFREILAQAGHAMSFSGEAVEMAVDALRSGTEAPR